MRKYLVSSEYNYAILLHVIYSCNWSNVIEGLATSLLAYPMVIHVPLIAGKFAYKT